jgi:hypothetical protein
MPAHGYYYITDAAVQTLLLQDDELRELIAGRIAYRLVESTNDCRMRHFFVNDERKPVPFPTQWHRKNMSGASFKHSEVAAAEAWVKVALLAGFVVCYSSITKRRWNDSMSSGRGLASGIYLEDEQWLQQELQARGLEMEREYVS